MAKNEHHVSRRDLLTSLFLFPSACFKQTLVKPSYQIGQWVSQTHIIDNPEDFRDGKQTYSAGYIVGLVFQHPEWLKEELRKGWTYYVKWYIDYGERCKPYVDFAHSSEIEIISNNFWTVIQHSIRT